MTIPECIVTNIKLGEVRCKSHWTSHGKSNLETWCFVTGSDLRRKVTQAQKLLRAMHAENPSELMEGLDNFKYYLFSLLLKKQKTKTKEYL